MLPKGSIYNIAIFFALSSCIFSPAEAQEEPQETQAPALSVDAGESREAIVGKELTFDITPALSGDPSTIEEIVWDFGDSIRATGARVNHQYTRPGTYTVRLRVTTPSGIYEDTTSVRIFEHLLLLITDSAAETEELEHYRRAAADQKILLLILRASNGPEALIEEELTQQLQAASPEITKASLIITWTSGTVGTNVLSKFAQQIHQSDPRTAPNLSFAEKGVIILTTTPLGVLTPAAQNVFDQLQPSYVLITRPAALELFLNAHEPEEVRSNIISSSIEYRLLGTFSARTVRDLGPTNFMSFTINFLVNRGVAINTIILILMLPLIASILAFARHVLGIKAFGLVTPTLTTLSFLVMGLRFGLIVFATILAAGTLTRLLLRRWRLLYLPRMALVLTSVSLGIIIFLTIGLATNSIRALSFSVFPTLILMLLAEEFIALQFKAGAKTALTVTAWTLALAILGYYVVSWQLLRTLLLSYPEIVLITIPLNFLLGQWSGLRLTEYFRFRELLRHGRFAE